MTKETPLHSAQDDTLHTAHPSPHTPYLKGSEATDPIPHTTKQPKVAAPHLKAAEGCDLTPHPSFIIVTAHHAGDQAETMYMRLRRGTTLAGLRGIQEVRVLDEASHTPKQPKVATPYLKAAEGCDLIPRAPYIKGSEATDPTPHSINHQSSIIHHQSNFIFRPFLSVTRADLLSYAREHNLTWCEDESNTDVKFARNKTRHEYLPHLEETNPGATMQLCKVARLADKAYAKVMEKCNELFNPIVSLEKEMPELVGHDKSLDLSTPRCSAQDDTSLTTRPSSLISLNKKALRKIFLANADADLSELVRLWLSEQGFRFPIGFFYSQMEPAHVKIPVRAAYRKRAIAKNGSTVRICEFESVEAALKFVSCEMK